MNINNEIEKELVNLYNSQQNLGKEFFRYYMKI